MNKIDLLGSIGAALSAVSAVMAAYLHFEVVPNARIAESKIKLLIESGNSFSDPQFGLLREIQGLQIDWGEYVLLAGAIAFLVSLYPAIKKSKMGQLGAILGIISFFIGAAYGTHMFS